ncbi:type IV toxin-antitoxin system AbiEi family antitoxin domain-containing protein [Catellatospora sp. KI3]|uniref:type IV toxin-antitoxin system AbiEi family antitoxin domain-containing protein n=1 Tax=Catellatospora sp. KI3 TaxID=3041620 RepID=UPI002482F3BE|nr:type IV toxin-antitoxin system AbiEi family antitoxin domain-containing protein [Catellatospora sp. KI3]MDI1461776.1 type IV toxin-antitoxin system AbiEi family antitoxin domain-containing protein [Catellatospora sp. KI3]
MLAVQRLVERQDGLITAAQCRELRLSTGQVKWYLRHGLWRVISRGVYLVDADIKGDAPPGARAMVRAAVLTGGPHAVAVLESAAVIHGLHGLRLDGRLHVSLPGKLAVPRRLGDTSVVPHQLTLAEGEVMTVDGIAVTTPLRTVADLMLKVDRLAAVSVLDSALHQGLFTEDDFPRLHGALDGRRGAVRARTWVDLADGLAESPLETRSRLRCVDGKVPPDELQAVIVDSVGVAIARVDLLWRSARLIGEADGGEVHERPEAVFRDRERQNALVNAGYRVIRFTWRDTLDARTIPAIVRRALAWPT